jgi:non-homologous end joining protein Ku
MWAGTMVFGLVEIPVRLGLTELLRANLATAR